MGLVHLPTFGMVKYIITWILCPYLVDFSDTNMDPMASKCDFSAFHPSAFGLWTIGSWASAIHLFELFAWAGWTVQIQRKKTCWIHLGVSKNRGTPKTSILIGFSIINHPFWGTPIFGNTHMGFYHQSFNVTIETTKSWQFCEKTWPFKGMVSENVCQIRWTTCCWRFWCLNSKRGWPCLSPKRYMGRTVYLPASSSRDLFLIPQMEVTFSPLKRSRIKPPKKVTNRKNLVPGTFI